MLRIYKSEDGGKLVKLKKNRVTPLSWYNMINPSVDEMEKVSEQLKLDSDMLKNALDLDERSRVEFDDGVLSLIINLPWMDDDGKFDTLPCGLFFTKNNFMTICSRENRIIGSFNKNTAKTFDTRERGRFLLTILSKCTQFYLKYLAIINQKTEEIEYSLRKTTKNKALFKLIEIQKSLVYFTTALKDNHLVLLKILRMVNSPAMSKLIKFTDDDIDELEDVIVENKQAIEMVDMHRSILVLYRLAMRQADKVLCLNEENRNVILGRKFCKPDNLFFLNGGEGVDLQRFGMAGFDVVSSGKSVFLMVGRILEDKGYRILVEAVRMLLDRGYGGRFRCAVLGPVDMSYPTHITEEEIRQDVAEGRRDRPG